MKRFLSLVFLLSFLVSCSKTPLIRPEGELVTRNFNIMAEVGELYAVGNYHIILDSSLPKGVVSVTTNENLMDYLQISDFENKLKLGMDERYRYDVDRITVRMSPAGLDVYGISGNTLLVCGEPLSVYSLKLIAQGGAEILFQDIKAKNVDLVASEKSLIRVKGMTIDVTIEASGASEVDAHELLCLEADVLVSGASFVSVYASGDLDIVSSGSSEVHYYGNPINMDVQSSGESKIKKC